MSPDITEDQDTITIYGTRYDRVLFKELGRSFPTMVGQVLRVERKEDGLLIVTRLPEREEKGRCKDCVLWTRFTDKYPNNPYPSERTGGICGSNKITENHGAGEYTEDSLVYCYDEGGEFWTGPEFGSIHWKGKK